MSALWEPVSNYQELDAGNFAWNTSNYSEFAKRFLPYRRLYESLDKKSLCELLKDAYEYGWQVLDLHCCGLSILPEDVWDLPNLRVLFLGNSEWGGKGVRNSFKHLPDSMRFLSNLQWLDLSGTQIALFPYSLSNLRQLQWLDLSGTKVKTLPENIDNLTKLQRLYLNGTNVQEIPAVVCNLFNLERLYFGGTQISALPEKIEKLQNLQILDLGGTQIGSISESFCGLKKLRRLYLSKTLIVELPDSFGNLTNLERLYLNRTQIRTLPESCGKLTKLQRLYLSQTNVAEVPGSFNNLSNLQKFDISGTPLKNSIPPELNTQSTKEIIRYILERQSAVPKKYFNESKMVVVGQGGVGKSCVINRLLYNKFEEQHTTEGIDIEHWIFTDKYDGEIYTLNVWDFGGQEIYHATHQFFLTRRTLYLLVWDALSEDDYGRRDYWMRTLQSFADESPVIIVVNKCDIAHGRYKEIEDEFLRRYPQIKKVFYVSCKDDNNQGMGKLKDYILAESVKLPLMKEIWTDVKLTIRRDLEKLSFEKNFIFYDQYVDVCKCRGLCEEIDQKSLIKQLHDLGIILYYHNDPLLCGIVILSPQWGTHAVYKVLDEQQRQFKGRLGVVYYDDLRTIWGNESDKILYPEGLYPYLLKLMEKFQLAFKLDNPKMPENTYLVAELLGENPVIHDWPSEGTEPLAFRYNYDFMPAGVMTRLIVSIHQYLDTVNDVKQCWRKGAYLVHGSANARIILYEGVDKKYIDIRIIGDSPRDRQELLTIIRSHVKKINERFNRIEITEQIPCRCSPSCSRFFSYQDLLNAEATGRTEVDCQRSWKKVSLHSLLDGIESNEVKEDYKQELTYRNDIRAKTIVINNTPGQYNDNVMSIHAKQNAHYKSDDNDKTDISEKMSNLSDSLLKFLIALIILLVLVCSGYLIMTGQITIYEWLKPILENLPGA